MSRITSSDMVERLENDVESCLSMSLGNSKLRKTSKEIKSHLEKHGSLNGFVPRPKAYRVASFNLPAGGYVFEGHNYITCPGADKCLAVCYARQGTFNFPNSKAVRILNHQALRVLYFTQGISAVVDNLDQQVKSLPKTVAVVRLHDSGDFFKKWYVQAWMEVIDRNSDILFYAYTKSHPMFKDISIPSNLRLTSSYGGKFDHQISGPNSKIFVSLDDRIAAGYIDGNESDMPAILGDHDIGLVYHGGRNLTTEQIEIFGV